MTRRARTVPTILTNTHQGECVICHGPITRGQGAYVRQDGRGATHSHPDQCSAP